MRNQLIIPETLYFATYVAIADNRIFDKEWILIDETIKSQGYEEDVRNKALSIVLERPDKMPLDQVIDVLISQPQEIRLYAVNFGLHIAFEDNSFGDNEEVFFRSANSGLKQSRMRS